MSDVPPLPPPDTHCFDDDTGRDVWSYSAAQMRAYALAARRAALEEAAQLLDTQHEARKHHDNHAAVYARMVRELADNPLPEACAGSAPR